MEFKEVGLFTARVRYELSAVEQVDKVVELTEVGLFTARVRSELSAV